MLCEEDQTLFYACKKAQVSRNVAINILNQPNGTDLIIGTVVRLLVELPGSRDQDYAMAFVIGTAQGMPYRGFSVGPQESTTYLVLRMARQLLELNGSQFQLNSISNGSILEGEFSRCVELFRNDGLPLPTPLELRVVAVNVKMFQSSNTGGGARQRVTAAGQGSNGQPTPSSEHLNAQSGFRRSSVHRNSRPDGNVPHTDFPRAHRESLGSGRGSFNQNSNDNNNNPLVNSPRPAKEEDVAVRLRDLVLQKLQQECTVFPRQGYADLKVSQLLILERDMTEYLQHVRDEIGNKVENCVVCLDHLPTIILLPCQHKVMCRLCATTVRDCPCCRSAIDDMFEVAEI